MAALADRIEALVAKVPHKTEAQLARMLFGNKGCLQPINAASWFRTKNERQAKGGLADPFTYRIAATHKDLARVSD
jgi:hypothetical protein